MIEIIENDEDFPIGFDTTFQVKAEFILGNDFRKMSGNAVKFYVVCRAYIALIEGKHILPTIEFMADLAGTSEKEAEEYINELLKYDIGKGLRKIYG